MSHAAPHASTAQARRKITGRSLMCLTGHFSQIHHGFVACGQSYIKGAFLVLHEYSRGEFPCRKIFNVKRPALAGDRLYGLPIRFYLYSGVFSRGPDSLFFEEKGSAERLVLFNAEFHDNASPERRSDYFGRLLYGVVDRYILLIKRDVIFLIRKQVRHQDLSVSVSHANVLTVKKYLRIPDVVDLHECKSIR